MFKRLKELSKDEEDAFMVGLFVGSVITAIICNIIFFAYFLVLR